MKLGKILNRLKNRIPTPGICFFLLFFNLIIIQASWLEDTWQGKRERERKSENEKGSLSSSLSF